MKYKNFYQTTKLGICQCGKRMYHKKDGETVRNFLMDKGKEKYLRIYQCNQCDFWHLTKRP
jgi:hypothetical protein